MISETRTALSRLPDDAFTRSRELLTRAAQVTPGGVHSNVRATARPQPLFFQRGAGGYLWDVDGHRYLDLVLGQGPVLLGHAHPAVTAAVTQALGQGQLYAGQHPAELELAELLCALLPCAERVRFGSSGTESVQAALRLARAATGRRRVLKFEGHYHGWVDTIFASTTPAKLGPAGATGAVAESAGQLAPRPDELSVAPWNDAEAVRAHLAQGDVAAVIMEPIAANHSVIAPEPGFLEAVRAACDRYGTALIFDEIITGFRLGLGGAQARLGVTPDLAVFGKAMANGFPISCVAGKAALFDGVAEGRVWLAGTFNGNVSSVAAALATLRVLTARPELYTAAQATGRRMMEGLRSLGVPDLVVQGEPELFWLGFGPGPVRAARDLERFDQVRTVTLCGELLRRGVYVVARGAWYLAGVHTAEDADYAIAAVADALGG